MAPVPLLPPDQFHPETEPQIMEHIFKSKLPDLPLPLHLSLHQYCFQNISQFPHKPAIIDGPSGRQISFEELQISSQKVAAGLSNLGIQQGDVVMLLLPNCIEFALVFLGASMRGAACTTSNPHYTASEIEKQLILSEAKLVVTVSSCIDKIKCENVQILTVDEEIEGYKHISELTEAPLVPDYPLEDIDPDDVVALPFSSGTTGLPKGVMLTHRSIVVNLAQQVDGDNPTIDMSSRDIILCVLPMFHIYSLSTILLCSIRVGATIVLMQKYEIRTLLDLIQSMKVTIAPLVPPCVLAMTKNPAVLEYDLSSVRMVLCGAAPLGKDVEDAFRERLPNAILSQGYGMTEAGPVLAMSMAFAKHPQPVKSGSCGTVIRNAEIKIIDPETGVSLPYNKSGEICIRSPQIMKGYLNDPKATAATIDRDGWLHTGDVGFIDTDEELFIVDRLKEIIKYKGFQVAPAELEKLLVSHECISDAAVVGRKDPNAGEIPVAFVVKCGALREEEIKEFIAKQVVFYKRLQSVVFIDSIPKTPAGKILRRELRDQYLN